MVSRKQRFLQVVLATAGIGVVVGLVVTMLVLWSPGGRDDLPMQGMGPILSDPSLPEAVPTTPEAVKPVSKPVCVTPFLPNHIIVGRYDAGGAVLETILESSMDPNDELFVDSKGHVRNNDGPGPRQAFPGVVRFVPGEGTEREGEVPPVRSRPATDAGTVQIDGHAQSASDYVFTRIVERMLIGREEVYGDGSYRVVLTGTTGQSLTYVIKAVFTFVDGEDNPGGLDPAYYTNTPNRLFLVTCEVNYDQEIRENRAVWAELDQSLSVGPSCS